MPEPDQPNDSQARVVDCHYDLAFTGERVVPGKVDPDLYNEHFARYAYAGQYCAGKVVLDTGCGVGYGASYLAERALRVVGVDRDGSAIRYACRHFRSPAVQYVVSDCEGLAFDNNRFDVVTSFELIEHLRDARAYLAEVRRVLKPTGLFIVSTPNRPVYDQHRAGEPNPFHTTEYDLQEFTELLQDFFPVVEVLGENHVSAVGILGAGSSENARGVVTKAGLMEQSEYFVCVCSHTPCQLAPNLVLVPEAANVLAERERHIRILESECEERQKYVTTLQAEFDEKAAWALRLNDEVQQARAEIQRLQGEMDALRVTWARGTRWKRAFMLSVLEPLSLLTAGVLFATEAVARVRRRFAFRPAPMEAPSDTSRCSIIVLTWEGKHLLEESLPPLLRAVHAHGGQHEVIVVDNGSTDGTREYVNSCFPEVRLVRSERNLFYTGGNNLGVGKAQNDLVVLLNNDMIVDENFLAPLLQGFQSADVFAVASQVFLHDSRKRREETGKARASFNGCDLDWRHESILPSDERQGYVPVFWGHGGAVALDRKKFLWLGGLDALFDPFYVEDCDLSYRAWKVGWRCLLAVHSKVIHKHRSSTSRFGNAFITQIVRRNQYLFLWKNFSDWRKLLAHFVRAPHQRRRRAGTVGAGIRLEAKAFGGAAKRIPAIVKRKLALARFVTRTDEEILRAANAPPEEAIRSNEVDFRHHDASEQLGEGWYGWEQSGEQGFRWTSQSAALFLRAPADVATLRIEGLVSGLSHRGGGALVLAIACDGVEERLRLPEGPFDKSVRLRGLVSGCAVEIRLTVDRTLTVPGDSRVLGLRLHRVALCDEITGGDAHVGQRSLRAAVSLTNPVLSQRPSVPGEKRILLLCAYLPCLGRHGGGNMMFNLIRHLSKRHRLTVLSFYDSEEELSQVEALANYCDHLEAIFRGQSREVHNPFGILPPEIVYEFYHERMSRLIAKHLQNQRFDLIQCEYLQMAHFASAQTGIPAVLTNHEVLSLSRWREYRNLPWMSRRKLPALLSWMRMLNYEEKLLHRFRAVMVLTEEEQEFLNRYAPGVKVYRHAMGVDCKYFQLSAEPPAPELVVFVGNFRHQPNAKGALWFLERVWPQIRKRRPGAQFHLVGPEPPPALREWDGREGVTVTGFVEDVRGYVLPASVFVAPLFEGAGLRTKVLEAWAMGKPVVGTSLAFAGLGGSEGELVLATEQPETFANLVCQLLEDGQLAARTGARARVRAEREFSWEDFAGLYDRVYQNIAGGSDNPGCHQPAQSQVAKGVVTEPLPTRH